MDPVPFLLAVLPLVFLLIVGVIVAVAVTRRVRRQVDEARRHAAEARRLLAEAAALAVPEPPEAPEPSEVSGPESERRAADSRGELAVLRAGLGRQEAALERLARRLKALEAAAAAAPERVEAATRESAPTDPVVVREAVDAEELVRAHVAALGYGAIVVLADSGVDHAFTVEARRNGLIVKGRAYVRPGSRVEAELRPALRAFP